MGSSSSNCSSQEFIERFDNPFTELQILHGHTDIIRIVAVLNEGFASGADDGCVCIWNTNGALLKRYCNHTLSITGLLALKEGGVVSASADGFIRVCDDESSIASDPQHNMPVRALRLLPEYCSWDNATMVSAGNDCLCLLDNECKVINRMIFSRLDENLRDILLLEGGRVLVAAHTPELQVYSLSALRFEHLLVSDHFDAINILEALSNTRFVSGALCGTIVLWGYAAYAPTPFSPLAIFSSQSPVIDLVFDSSVLIAASGVSLTMLNKDDLSYISEFKEIGESNIVSVRILGEYILSASSGEVSIWKGNSLIHSFDPHSASIIGVTPLNSSSFVSYGADAKIVIWRNSKDAFIERRELARKAITQCT